MIKRYSLGRAGATYFRLGGFTTTTVSKVFRNARGEEIPYDGHSLLTWRVSSHVVVIRQDRLLLVEQVYLPGRLELPGGGVEPEETILEGAVRECWEETGYHFTPSSTIPLFAAEQFFCHKQGANFRHALVFAFVGSVSDYPDASWQPGPEDKGATVHWLPLDKLRPELFHPNHWSALLLAGVVKAMPA